MYYEWLFSIAWSYSRDSEWNNGKVPREQLGCGEKNEFSVSWMWAVIQVSSGDSDRSIVTWGDGGFHREVRDLVISEWKREIRILVFLS